MSNNFISLIVPTYNERSNIVPLVERIHRAIGNYNYEIVFVDDDSPDGTSNLVRSLSSKYPVRVITRSGKRGLASAVIDGLKETKGDIIGSINADLQHPPEILPELIRQLEEGADVAIASRYVKGSNCQDWGLARRIISKGAITLAHLLLPSTRQITDPMSGFYMLRRHVIASADLRPSGYKVLLEMLMEGNFQKVTEVPYTFSLRNNGRSKLGFRQYFDYLWQIFRLMKRKGELLRFVKFYLVGTIGTLLNMGLLWILTEFIGLPYLISAVIATGCAIISNFILNNFFTFSDRCSATVPIFVSRLLKFSLVSLSGMAINVGALWLFTEVAGIYYLHSNLLGIVLATLLRYIANSLWTWG